MKRKINRNVSQRVPEWNSKETYMYKVYQTLKQYEILNYAPITLTLSKTD